MTPSGGLACLFAMALISGASPAAEIACRAKTVEFVGRVVDDDPVRLVQQIRSCFPSGNEPITLTLNSNGGLSNVGMEIGLTLAKISQKRIVRTVVSPGGYCISACTSIFLGGSFREVRAGASLEPHSFGGWNSQSPQSVKSWAGGVEEGILDPDRTIVALRILDAHLSEEGRSPPEYASMIGALSNGDWDSAQSKYRAAPEKYRMIFDETDGLLRLWLSETERRSALEDLLRRLEAPQSEMPGTPELRGMQAHLDAVIDRQLGSNRAFRKSTQSTSGGEVLQRIIEKVASSARENASRRWPLLQARANELDVTAWVRYMYSTSIIYTRPLTREELCDSNIMNVGCD